MRSRVVTGDAITSLHVCANAVQCALSRRCDGKLRNFRDAAREPTNKNEMSIAEETPMLTFTLVGLALFMLFFGTLIGPKNVR